MPWLSARQRPRLRARHAICSARRHADARAAPVLRLHAVPQPGPDPAFDTALADFNFPQLFTENRFIGGDRFGDANQLTLAVTSRFLQANGQERLRATLGQRYYFRDERVGLTPDLAAAHRAANRTSSRRSAAARAPGLSTSPRSTTRTSSAARAYGVSVRYAPEVAKVFNASYRYQREHRCGQIDLSGQWPVAARLVRRRALQLLLPGRRLLEGLAGAEYNAGCWVFRFVVQRVQAAARWRRRRFFQLEFNGVGQVGTAEAVQLLRRDVPGYSVTQPQRPGARAAKRALAAAVRTGVLMMRDTAPALRRLRRRSWRPAQAVLLVDRIVAVVNKDVITALGTATSAVGMAERQLQRQGTPRAGARRCSSARCSSA